MRNLRLWDQLRDDDSSQEQRASLPTLAEVLYCPPNPDNSNKRCGNCISYAYGRGQCYLHDPALAIRPDAVCGYHIFCFAPRKVFAAVVPMQPVTPALSGLRDTDGGIACDTCTYYAEQGVFATDQGVTIPGGECMATVGTFGMPAKVAAKGACARYTPPKAEAEMTEEERLNTAADEDDLSVDE